MDIKIAVEKIRKKYYFNKMELDWLKRIEKQLIKESVLNRETFETGAFKTKGGYAAIDRIFSNKLEAIITDINEFLYGDRSAS